MLLKETPAGLLAVPMLPHAAPATLGHAVHRAQLQRTGRRLRVELELRVAGGIERPAGEREHDRATVAARRGVGNG